MRLGGCKARFAEHSFMHMHKKVLHVLVGNVQGGQGIILSKGLDPGRRVSAVIFSSEEGEIREGRMKQPGQKGVGWARMMVVGGLGGVHDGR